MSNGNEHHRQGSKITLAEALEGQEQLLLSIDCYLTGNCQGTYITNQQKNWLLLSICARLSQVVYLSNSQLQTYAE